MDSTYITKSGDTWDVIAKEVYEDEYGAGILMAANPTLIDNFIFSAGEVITVPELEEEIDSDLPPWKQAAEEDDDDYYDDEDDEYSEDEDEGDYEQYE